MNKEKSISLVSLPGTLSLGIMLGILIWFLDAAIDVYLLGDESFLNAVFSPGIEQIWMRIFIICLMVIFSIIARFINNKRKATENALIESEERFRSLIIGSSDGIIIHNGERIIEANQKLADLLGYELLEIVGKSPWYFLDEESQKRITENIQDEDNTLFQVTAIRKNGNKVTYEYINRMIPYYGETVWITTVSDCSVPAIESEGTREDPEHYRQLLQNSNDPLFVYGLTNENNPDLFLEASEMACTKFGYSFDEYEKLSIMEIIVPEERDNIFPIFQTLIDFKHSIFETEILTKDKDRVPVEISSHLFDLDSRPMIISTLREITERKKASQLLHDSEKQYRQLFSNAPVAYLCLDPDGNIIEVNDKWCDLFGYSKEETRDSWFGDFLSRSSLDRFRASFADLNESNEQMEIDLEIANKDKTISNIFLIARTAQNSFGDIQSAQCILLNNSRQKNSIEEKQRQERWLEQIIDNATDVIFSFKPDSTITNVNPAFEKVMGNPAESFIDSKFETIIHPDDLDFVYQAIDKCIEGEKIPAIEIRLQTESKEYIPTELTLTSFGQDGEVIGINCIAKALTGKWQKSVTLAEVTSDPNTEETDSTKNLNDNIREIFQSYQTLTENLPGLVYRVHCQENNRMQFFNDLVESITGYSEDELTVGEVCSIEPLIHEEDRPNVVSVVEEAIKGNKSFEVEYRLRHKNGDIKYFIERGQPVFDSDGSLISIDGVIFDITDRKQAEEALQNLSVRNKAILEEVPDIIMEVDSDKVYTWTNKAGHEFFGEDVIGKEASFYFEGEQNTYETVKPLLEGYENLVYVESWQRRKDGEKRLLAWWCQVLKNDDGNITGVLSTARDITEIKMAEEKLRESEEKFRNIVELSVDGISLIDKDCKIIEWNPGLENITGLKKEDILGKSFYDIQYQLVPEESKTDQYYQMLKGSMQEITKGGQSPYLNKFMETEIVRPDGVQRTVETLTFPIKSENGLMICGINRDVTDKKLMEDELSKAEKLESIGVLACGIAHDFNNILTAILGNISLAKMDTVPESDMNARLIDAEKASEQARYLTRQLLTFSKGGAPIKKTISLQNLIKESTGFALHGSNVKALYNIPDDLKAVDADTDQIGQVINNLIINANQAMPDGGTINISAKNVDIKRSDSLPLKEGQYVRIVISDEGTGIPEDHLNRIFDPYFTTRQKGSGLGFATAYSIIKNHDGHIDVESKRGEWTSFTIHLPVSDKPEEIEIEEEDIKAVGGKILVMDDEDAIRMVTGVALTKAGYKVDFAVNGKEAVEKYKSSFEEGHPFDLIFMDPTIPGGMSGQETLEKIKEFDPNVKAISSSDYSNNPIMSDHKKYGFCGIISKPYKAEDINRIVYQVLHGDKVSV